MTTWDCVHGLYYRLWNTLNVIDCELYPTEFSLISSEDSLCILVRELCNFPARFIVMIKQKESVSFTLFHKASSYLSMLCHCTRVYLYM